MAAIGAALAFAGATASAQAPKGQPQGPSNPLQGFSVNREKPIKIKASTLEVRDKDKVATFSGDVIVIQGDTEMRCKILIVFYEDDPGKPAAQAAQPGPGGQQQIRRMEAKGGVIVTQKDQIATGDSGEYDMRTTTVTLIGNVVVTKGQDVLRGQRLVVNTTTGVSRMESGGGRVEGLFQSSPREGPGQPRPQRPN
jgi:lipopolysaccharide export system protein LptA